MFGHKIKTIRELRNFFQEYMADKLGIAQNTYSKIETCQTKLSADILKKIADLLGVSPVDILSNQPTLISFEPLSGKEKRNGFNPETLQQELIDKLVASKDGEIQHLKEIIAALMKEKETLFQLFKSG